MAENGRVRLDLTKLTRDDAQRLLRVFPALRPPNMGAWRRGDLMRVVIGTLNGADGPVKTALREEIESVLRAKQQARTEKLPREPNHRS